MEEVATRSSVQFHNKAGKAGARCGQTAAWTHVMLHLFSSSSSPVLLLALLCTLLLLLLLNASSLSAVSAQLLLLFLRLLPEAPEIQKDICLPGRQLSDPGILRYPSPI